tara:strand:+ start:2205 stop:2381 length:177 start_codon:yes stop_codon:yes gene_type:complete
MNPLEKRNLLINKMNRLKEKLKSAEFMEKLELKDEVFELEKEIKKIDIQDQSNDCEIC